MPTNDRGAVKAAVGRRWRRTTEKGPAAANPLRRPSAMCSHPIDSNAGPQSACLVPRRPIVLKTASGHPSRGWGVGASDLRSRTTARCLATASINLCWHSTAISSLCETISTVTSKFRLLLQASQGLLSRIFSAGRLRLPEVSLRGGHSQLVRRGIPDDPLKQDARKEKVRRPRDRHPVA